MISDAKWCRIGKWCRWKGAKDAGYPPIFLKIENIVDDRIYSGKYEGIPTDQCVPAKIHPWSFEEAPEFIKANLSGLSGPMVLILCHCGNRPGYRESTRSGGGGFWDLEYVAKNGTKMDGSPCGKPELI